MSSTPKSNRMHIGIFGRRNSGKSSIINALANQNVAVVSNFAGTTTDPIYKTMELLPIGPIVIIDTAGLDDTGDIGKLRVEKSREVMDKTDLALLVFDSSKDLKKENFSFEKEVYKELKKRNITVIGVINKIDLCKKYSKEKYSKDINNTLLEKKNSTLLNLEDLEKYISKQFKIPIVSISAQQKLNISKLKNAIIKYSPTDYEKSTIVGDIINPKDVIVLVAPQDIQAPKGRLILPQVQVIRDILDNDAMALTVKDTELENILKVLNKKPDLVITDSQVFKKVNSILDKDIPLTSFSILMSRYKGDLSTLIKGAEQIDKLKDNDKVLIAEACTHHPLDGDIARVKLPKWLKERTKCNLNIEIKSGTDFPQNLNEYKLIIHCGACMFNRKQFMTRIKKTQDSNIPITNYGIAIAYMNGILKRVTNMFNI